MFPALEGLEVFYEIALDEFIEEQMKHDYKKYSENPYYEQLKAFVDSMNPLIKYFGLATIRLSDEVKRGIKRSKAK